MAVDLRAVAAASGVSVSTASRALTGSTRVSATTRRRVQSAADRLGYRPNQAARSLRTARSPFVGLVVTNLVNASFPVIANVVQRHLDELGLQMTLSVTGGDPEHERRALRMLGDHNAAGAIVVGSDLRAADELHRMGLPIVHLARRPGGLAGDCVLADELAGAREATAYLAGLGHRRIAVVAGPQSVTSGKERLQGYRLALDEAGLPWRDELVVEGPLVSATGATAVASLLSLPVRRRPTALLVANTEAALGVLPELQRRQISVPDQLSVLCYDDSQPMQWWHPTITVVDVNPGQMGDLAARLLTSRISGDVGPDVAPREYRIASRLIVRDSTAAPAKR